MRLFNKVAIVGVGLIGGSLALDIKKKKLARTICGVCRHTSSLLIAKKHGIIDEGSTDLAIIKGADLIVLATPVNVILESARRIATLSGPDCIVTDVGSTKEEIVSQLNKIFPRFVGSHPLAGSEKRGAAHARAGLFKDSLSILTPLASTEKKALQKIQRLWKMVGAKVVTMAPGTHDEIVACVSHVPHVVAFSLMNSVPKEYLAFAPGSLRDSTRVASSDSMLWAQIFLSNHKIIGPLRRLQRHIQTLRSAIEHKDAAALTRLLAQAKAKRDTLR